MTTTHDTYTLRMILRQWVKMNQLEGKHDRWAQAMQTRTDLGHMMLQACREQGIEINEKETAE